MLKENVTYPLTFLVPKMLKENVIGTKKYNFILQGLKTKLRIFIKTKNLINPRLNKHLYYTFILVTR